MVPVPSRLVPLILRLMRLDRDGRSREHAQAALTKLIDNPRVLRAPRRVPRGVRVVEEQHRGWTVFRVTPTAAPARGKAMYFHGGAFISDIHAVHWKLIAQVVAQTHVEMLVPMYPLVPEGGTGVAVVETATQMALDAGEGLILMGDSAGAQIAYGVAGGLRDLGVVAPLTVLISPPIDLEMTNPRYEEHAHRDPWLRRDGLVLFAEMWVGEHGFGHAINPVNADPTGLGPMLVFSGTLDILNLDVEDWVARLRSVGVEVELQEEQGQVHVYPLLPTIPGARARRRIVERVGQVQRDRQGR